MLQVQKNENDSDYNHIVKANDYYSYNYQSTIPENKYKPPIFKRNWFLILMMIFVSPVGIFLMWYYKEWKTVIKIAISIILIFYFTIYCGILF